MTDASDRRTGRRGFLETMAAVGLAGSAGCLESASEAVSDPADGDPGTGREPRWRFELSGWPSTPVVDGDTLYVSEVFGAEDGGLHAVATDDGTERWSYVAGGNVYDPTVRGDTAFAGRADGMFALSTAGDERWVADLPDAVGVPAVTVTDDAVYASSIANRLYALSRADGTEAWTFRADRTNFFGSAVHDGTVYVGCNQGSYVYDDDEWGVVYAVDAETGAERWRTEFDRPVECPATVVDDVVYVGSRALSTADGSVIWEAPAGTVEAQPVVVDGTVFVGSTDDSVYALSAADGTVRWEFETGFDVSSRPTVADGTVHVGSGDGTLYALAASDGTEQWRFELGADIYASPVVTSDTVYVGGTDHYVYALPR
ncbi:outer membrane protein assembly factor BamB family protein [Halostella litorea]|uniref:outer membrane protein assembly factor BamB family protein n=1 Tax=Halostella litorea TaxID=2528831 RepID=UPI0010919954|nr:PQQ-binding-like beta-propeller repeat protein [Halostella litorea]